MAASPISPESVGFTATGDGCWRLDLEGTRVIVRSLRRLSELVEVEALQVEVFGVSERDVIPASELVVVPETGGSVFGVFLDGGEKPEMIGALVGWGGFVVGEPRLVSDMMAIRAGHRGRGLGERLKKLQAAVASSQGFRTVVWTVDPLRAANARLNFGKLGAVAGRYERDRYGTGFAAGLAGALPSDRVHVEWAIGEERVGRRIIGLDQPPSYPSDLPIYRSSLAAGHALVPIPIDVDALVRCDFGAALSARLAVRDALERAFREGWVVDGFASEAGRASLVLSRLEEAGRA